MKLLVLETERKEDGDLKITLQVVKELTYPEKDCLAEARDTLISPQFVFESLPKMAAELFFNKHFAGNTVASAALGEALVAWALNYGYRKGWAECEEKNDEKEK